jgi:hypothetical protein
VGNLKLEDANFLLRHILMIPPHGQHPGLQPIQEIAQGSQLVFCMRFGHPANMNPDRCDIFAAPARRLDQIEWRETGSLQARRNGQMFCGQTICRWLDVRRATCASN